MEIEGAPPRPEGEGWLLSVSFGVESNDLVATWSRTTDCPRCGGSGDLIERSATTLVKPYDVRERERLISLATHPSRTGSVAESERLRGLIKRGEAQVMITASGTPWVRHIHSEEAR